MKRQLPVGLVVEGNATSSAVLRLPGLNHHIGPIKSNALRVARRFANSFRAGFAVETFEELGETRLVLLRVPDASLDRIVQELCASDLDVSGMCFAVCETWLASDSLAPLRERGAAAATLSALPGSGPRWFITEGDKAALRPLRHLLEFSGARVIAIRDGTKPLYFAAEHLATVLPLSLLNTAQAALRESGISGRILTAVLERMAQRLVKNFRAGSRMTQVSPFEGQELTDMDPELAMLGSKLPEIAHTLNARLEELADNFPRRRRQRSLNGSR